MRLLLALSRHNRRAHKASESARTPASGSQISIESREDLIVLLSEASTLEHMVMCEYLFASFSLKRNKSEGLTARQLDAVRRWEGTITTVAVQEMLHLALVNNLLTSIGASPYFDHPNFPQPSKYFSPNVQLALLPFGEHALRHYLYLERPEGMSIERVPGLELPANLQGRSNSDEKKGGGDILPRGQYFSTVGSLYRGIEEGFRHLVDKYGEKSVFVGAGLAQATEDYFGWPELVAVRDLSSAIKAIEEIVTAGEGARGDWEHSHFGMFLKIFNEHSELKKSDPDFVPARAVVAAYVRPPSGTTDLPMITDPTTARMADLFNASYGLAIQVLSRFFAGADRDKAELKSLSDVAVDTMAQVLKPLGVMLTTMPVGANLPGVKAGATFELQHRDYLLPHRREARAILGERLGELTDYCSDLANTASSIRGELKSIENSLRKMATSLGRSKRRAPPRKR